MRDRKTSGHSTPQRELESDQNDQHSDKLRQARHNAKRKETDHDTEYRHQCRECCGTAAAERDHGVGEEIDRQ